MSDLNTLKLYLEEELKTLDLPENPTNLYEPIRYILTLGGKRIRPVLVLMACDLFAGDYKKAISAAKAIELFHNFSLMHDDIMDDAPLRRGKTTVHEKWNEHVAILSGDAMLICAYKELLKSEGNTTSLVEIFNNVALEVCEGQMLDMNFETRFDVHVDEYLHMISQKTAILLSGALRIGALIGKASPTDVEQLGIFGKKLGIAFQLRDDLLDVYADQSQFGKQVGGDILSNKKTYLLLKALEQAQGDDLTT
ncbi:MAG: geranylgeranyl diphosphate synthase type II, partial [Sphingobacteriales bacterium]